MENKNTVGLIGYYSQNNYGDDLLGYLFYNRLNSLPNAKAVLFEPSNQLKMIVGKQEVYYGANQLSECSHVVFGGGGVLGELNPRRFGWRIFVPYLKKIRILRKLGIPYYFVCVGVGPIYSKIGRLMIKYMVKYSALTIVRDEESFNQLMSLGLKKNIVEAVDYALGFKEKLIPEASKGSTRHYFEGSAGPILGVNLCEFNCHVDTCGLAVDEEIINILKEKRKSGYFKDIIVIVSMLNGPESIGAIKLLSAFPDAKLYVHKDIFETSAIINELDYLITQKLHVSIVGYCMSIPTVCIGYHPKIKRFYDYVSASSYYISMTSGTDIENKIDLLFKSEKEIHPFVNKTNVVDDINDKLSYVDKLLIEKLI